MKKMVNGIEVEMTAEEVSERQAEEAVAITKAATRNILNQIAELENQITPRRMREALVSGDFTFIENIENQIQTLRGQL